MKTKASREFQVFVKPIGAVCNLDCHYCYYLEKGKLYPKGETFRMPSIILEEYIVQHIEAYPEEVIRFSWHGGEPTLLGLDYFRKIVALQDKHKPSGQRIMNGMQTKGTLLDEDWCRFLADEGFAVGISIDGPREMHDKHRLTRDQKSSFEDTMRGYRLLRQYGVNCDILCVVNAHNVQYPLEVYRFFKEIEAPYLSFLPMVERQPEGKSGFSPNRTPTEADGGLSHDKTPIGAESRLSNNKTPIEADGGLSDNTLSTERERRAARNTISTKSEGRADRNSVPAEVGGVSDTTMSAEVGGVSDTTMSAEAWGDFLCSIFDEWVEHDVGRIKVQIFEEATRTAFDQEHSLCIFRPICGDIPVVEHNGDFYSCDHFVDGKHRLGNIMETPLVELLESPQQREFGKVKLNTLPRYCMECEVRDMCNGECPKNRFILTPDGEPGLNYLCAGYKRFFTHCKPFVQEVAKEWRRQSRKQ